MKTAAVTLSADSPTWARDLSELTKLRLTFLVLITTAAGFYMAGSGPFDGWRFVHTLLGTALVAAAASALNQILEKDVDAKMRRTEQRPLPTGRMQSDDALLIAAVGTLGGLAWLGWAVNPLAALLAGLTLVLYAFIYTPLKRSSTLNTLVGAIPGALPPVIGWVAARGQIDNGAILLFLILFFWQMPHFLAIAWLYRDDYAAAGLKMLPVVDGNGGSTGRQAFVYTIGLLPISLLPFFFILTGRLYFCAALGLGFGFAWYAWKFMRRPERDTARALFLASVAYLPVLLLFMALGKTSL